MSIKEKILSSPALLHPHNEPCPPIMIQSWLRAFWKDSNYQLYGKWGNGVSVKTATLNAIRETANTEKSLKQVLKEWGFEDNEAEDLMKSLL